MIDSPEVERLRAKLEGCLRQSLTNVGVDESGDFMVRYESAIVWIRPEAWTEGRTLARVWSITNVAMRLDGELARFLLAANARIVFGGFRLEPSPPATVLVHVLLGDYLNRNELLTAVASVATEADRYGPEIKARFGGRLFDE
jgi:type III secretion system-like peptide-binding chaperone